MLLLVERGRPPAVTPDIAVEGDTDICKALLVSGESGMTVSRKSGDKQETRGYRGHQHEYKAQN